MANWKKITRRSLLVGSAAIAGGVAFGVWRYQTPYDNPLKEGLSEGAAALTPYVLIDAEGITLVTPRSDVGQGAYSVQAALIAEELDVSLDQVRVWPGPPSPAYWNRALATEAAVFMAPAEGLLRSMTETGVSAAMKFIGLQITGGSTTVPDGYEKLRRAGASARETLKRAAAQRGHDPAAMTTRDGSVILGDGAAIPYTDLASEAAEIDVVQDVGLRDPSTWRLLNNPMQRIDIVDKSIGMTKYGIDLSVPGMLHATVCLNPAQGGGIDGFDAEDARAMPGIHAVVPVTGGLGVVADTTWQAFEAARSIRASWTPSPMPATMDGHWQALANSFTDTALDSRKRDDGDIDAALTEDALAAEYRAPYLAHAPMEPIGATVRVTEDGVEIWSGTQIPRFVQENVSAITGHSADQVTLHTQIIGGSFGHRLEDMAERHATEIANTMRGTAVKLTYERETDMAHDFPRQIAMARMRGSVSDGRVTAYDLSIAMPSVMASQMGRQNMPVPGPDSQIVAGAFEQPFAIPHHRVTGYRAPALAPISSWRSVGASSNGFFYNAGLDELIHAAGADPLEERLRLCDDPLARATLEAVGEMSGWSGPKSGARGRGVALTTSFGVPCAEIVEVTETEDGLRITNVWAAAEVGRVMDPINAENQMQGGIVFGLGHAMNCELTYTDGKADQLNYHAYQGMRLHQCPTIEVRLLENGDRVTGLGEPPVPPAAPALAAAIFALTGQRLREMPFSKFVEFA